MKILFAGDHAGFEMKGKLMEFIRSLGHEVEDMGPHVYNAEDDYPDFVVPLARKVAGTPIPPTPFPKGRGSVGRATPSPLGRAGGGVVGIIVAGSGQGEVIAANRVRGARAILYYGGDTRVVRVAREHNDANMLSLGARFVRFEEAQKAVRVFLETPFSRDERHMRRVRKIDAL